MYLWKAETPIRKTLNGQSPLSCSTFKNFHKKRIVDRQTGILHTHLMRVRDSARLWYFHSVLKSYPSTSSIHSEAISRDNQVAMSTHWDKCWVDMWNTSTNQYTRTYLTPLQIQVYKEKWFCWLTSWLVLTTSAMYILTFKMTTFSYLEILHSFTGNMCHRKDTGKAVARTGA